MTEVKSSRAVESLFGATVPVLQAGMGGVAQHELAAAVCEAGAFGMVGLYRHQSNEILELIAATARLTDRRFGVNFVPFVLSDDELIERIGVVLQSQPSRPPIVTFFGLPSPQVLGAVAGRADFGVQAGTLADIEQAFDAGASFTVLQTTDAGGHHLGGIDRAQAIRSAKLLKLSARMVFLSGGISTSGEVKSVLDAGFSGVLCGTIFAAALESAAHAEYKQIIVDARAEDTVITDRFSIGWHTHTHRVVKNKTCTDDLMPAHIIGKVHYFGKNHPIPRYSVAVPTRSTEGEIAAMALYCGTSCKSVDRIATAREIVRQLIL